MDIEQLVKEFQLWNPGLVSQMRECSHHFSPKDLNPYHLENDVWCHTCMCLKELNLSLSFYRLFYDFDLAIKIAVLCHDLGKIYTRHSPSPGKIAMYNHAFASIQDTIDFYYHLYHLEALTLKDDNPSSINLLKYILTTISNHMDFMQCEDDKKRTAMCNYDPKQIFLNNCLLTCDIRGSLREDGEQQVPILESIDDGPNKELSDCDVVLLSGVTGVGKDTIAKLLKSINKPGIKILSYDDIRTDIYKSISDQDHLDNLSEFELYRLAWEYCSENKIDLNKYLRKRVEKELFSTPNVTKVIISNTNLSRKRRRSIINYLGRDKYTFGSIFVCSTSDRIFERNKNREDKQLDRGVIQRFMYNQQIPTMNEGFDCVSLVTN